MFSHLFNFGPKKEDKQPLILPENLRYAMNFLDGKLTKDNILQVLSDSRYCQAGFYLTNKAFEYDINEVLSILNNTGNMYFEQSPQEKVNLYLKEKLEQSTLNEIPGKKLGQISPFGFDTSSMFKKIIDEKINTHSRPVGVVAYAGLLAYKDFIESKSISDFYIIFPKSNNIVHVIKEKGLVTVQMGESDLNDDSRLSNGFDLVDDTYKTGESFNSAERVIKQSLNLADEILFSHHVILRNDRV